MKDKRYWLESSFWLIIAVLFIEVLLKLFVVGYFGKYTYDPIMGNVLASDAAILWRTEGSGFVRFVDNGEIYSPYMDGINIVVLGDSHTEAFQVNDTDNFVSVAEEDIRKKGYKVNLHNLGQSGRGLADYVYVAPYIAEKYKPNLVVVQVSESDFRWEETFNPEKTNYFVKGQDEELILSHTNPKRYDTWKGDFRRAITLIDYGLIRFEKIKKQHLPQKLGGQNINRLGENKNWSEDETRQLVKKLIETYAQYNISVIFVVIPYEPAIEGKQLRLSNKSYENLLITFEQLRVTSVDPLPEFLQLVEEGKLPRGFENTIPGEGHLNVYGHKTLGLKLSYFLMEKLK